MFKHLTYRKRIFLLLGGFVISLLICHALAFKKTVLLKREVRQLKSQLEIAENAPQQIASLETKMNEIEEIIGESFNSEKDIQELILEKISNYCLQNRLVVKEFPQATVTNDQEYLIETNKIIVGGSFVRLLRLLYFLEKDTNIGKVVSVDFISDKDFKTKRTLLTMSVFFQNIKMMNDAK